jgi:hypothetical protein
VDEAQAVLTRLERIERLERGDASRGDLLEELRGLLTDAEAWSKREGGDAGGRAVDDLRSALSAVT